MSNENGAGFDFKPADPVLVRNFKNETWELNFFGRRFNLNPREFPRLAKQAAG